MKSTERMTTAPTMGRILEEDLVDDARSLVLFDDAVRGRFSEPGEASRLRFFALMERARRCGRNPPAMFRALVAKGLDYATLADEDLARGRLLRISGQVAASSSGATTSQPERAQALLQRALWFIPSWHGEGRPGAA
jgi:hypothetical protein